MKIQVYYWQPVYFIRMKERKNNCKGIGPHTAFFLKAVCATIDFYFDIYLQPI